MFNLQTQIQKSDEMFAIDNSEFRRIMESQAKVEKGTNPQTINPGTCICNILNGELPEDILQRNESKKSYELAPNSNNRECNSLKEIFNKAGWRINYYNNLLKDALERLEKKGCQSESLQKKTSKLQLSVSEQINELVKCCSDFRNTLSNNDVSQDVINDRIEEFKETINGTNAEVTNKILEFNKTLNEEDQYYLMPRIKTTNDDQNGIRRTNLYDYCIDDIKIDDEQFEKLEKMFQLDNNLNNLDVRRAFKAYNEDDSTNKVTHIYDIRLFNMNMLNLLKSFNDQLINELQDYRFDYYDYFDGYNNLDKKIDSFGKKLNQLNDILNYTKTIADKGMKRTEDFFKCNKHLNNIQDMQPYVKLKYEYIYENIITRANTILDEFEQEEKRINEITYKQNKAIKMKKKLLFHIQNFKKKINNIRLLANQKKLQCEVIFSMKNIKNNAKLGNLSSVNTTNKYSEYKY